MRDMEKVQPMNICSRDIFLDVLILCDVNFCFDTSSGMCNDF